MSIKLTLLKSGETVISDAKELISEGKVCGYLLSKPEVVSITRSILLTEEENANSGQIKYLFLHGWYYQKISNFQFRRIGL